MKSGFSLSPCGLAFAKCLTTAPWLVSAVSGIPARPSSKLEPDPGRRRVQKPDKTRCIQSSTATQSFEGEEVITYDEIIHQLREQKAISLETLSF